MAASLNVSGAGKYLATAWTPEVEVARTNVLLRSVVVSNKSGATIYVGLYDTPDGSTTNAISAPIEFEVADDTAGGISFDVPHRFSKGLLIVAAEGWGDPGVAGDDAKFLVHYEIGPVSQ